MKFCVLPLSRSLSPSWHSPLTPGKELPPRVFHGDGLSWWRKREEHAHASIPSPFVVSAPVHAQDMTSGTTLPSCRTQFHTSSLVASCRNILRFISALLELIFSRISFSVFLRISLRLLADCSFSDFSRISFSDFSRVSFSVFSRISFSDVSSFPLPEPSTLGCSTSMDHHTVCRSSCTQARSTTHIMSRRRRSRFKLARRAGLLLGSCISCTASALSAFIRSALHAPNIGTPSPVHIFGTVLRCRPRPRTLVHVRDHRARDGRRPRRPCSPAVTTYTFGH